jgi:beta-mannosidase
MMRSDLGGGWRLAYFGEKKGMPETPAEMRTFDCGRCEARVPGNAELDLSRAGVLPEDLFFGENILKVREYETFQWWYEREFVSPEWGDTDLGFEGLDCFATVWVNDIEAGGSANALIPHRFNISGLLRPAGEKNTVTVRLASPLNAAKDMPFSVGARPWGRHGRYESVRVRKPAHCYGWDIMPRALSAGIWRPVYLEERRATDFEELFFNVTDVSESEASLDVFFAFRTDLSLNGFSLRVKGKCGDSEFSGECPVSFSRGELGVSVKNPKLWMPRGYGGANLYDVTAELLHNGKVAASATEKIGLRTVELRRSDVSLPEKPGEFVFLINGVKIFCRGSNWVPADAFHSRDAERIPRILELFKDMDCNIIRCWGGNVYEPREFYDFCDQEGIMVWQDFGMACALYPHDEEFQGLMREECAAVIKTLRNRACVVLWSGDNECDQMSISKKTDPNRNILTRATIPETVRAHDPFRPWLPSSPYISPEAFKMPSPDYSIPEQHLWGPRGYYKADFYAKNTAVFVSEIGYHGCPNVSSLKKFIAGDLMPRESSLDCLLHATEPFPENPLCKGRIDLMANQIRELFGAVPQNIEDFAVASQIVQAEAKKFFVELFRQNKWKKTGIIWWNMMDGWPQYSDAIVDYYFSKKLAYHYLKRAHGPFALIVGEPEDGKFPLWAVNDTLKDISAEYAVTDADSGAGHLNGSVRTPANGRALCGMISPPAPDGRGIFLAKWTLVGGGKGAGHYLYGKPPFDFERYRQFWLPKIAALDGAFKSGTVGI